MNRYNMGVPVPILGEYVNRTWWNRHSSKGGSGGTGNSEKKKPSYKLSTHVRMIKMNQFTWIKHPWFSHGVFVVFLFIIWDAVGLSQCFPVAGGLQGFRIRPRAYKATERVASLRYCMVKSLPSSKLTWQWNITIFNRKYIFNFKWSIFHCYVSLPEGRLEFNKDRPLSFQLLAVLHLFGWPNWGNDSW